MLKLLEVPQLYSVSVLSRIISNVVLCETLPPIVFFCSQKYFMYSTSLIFSKICFFSSKVLWKGLHAVELSEEIVGLVTG